MLQLRNQFIMAPLKLGYADGDGMVNERHLRFYTRRSAHLGAVALEPLYMDKGLREIPTQLGIDSDDKIPGFRRLTDAIHREGAQVIAHLNHPGRMANPKLPGNYHISSTGKPCENGGAKPQVMDRAMMDRVIAMFSDAARRAEASGFDIIELQFGHGYLMAQFLSPAVNDRTDDYGGSFENRSRFPLEVLGAVKAATRLPLIARISGDEIIPQGLRLEEMIRFSKILEQQGVEAVHVSAGSACSTPPWFFQHMFVPKGKTWEMAAVIREHLGIPVVFVGQVNTTGDIQMLLEKYPGSLIALGRAMVADPDFVGKYTGTVPGNIRPCLACSDGCLGNVRQGNGLGCVVNPEVNRELPAFSPAARRERIAVIGGGLAGMQAAITLKERGFAVTLFEKEQLGGQFNLAWLPPKKENLKKIVDYYLAELERLEIPVEMKEATEEVITKGQYDRVIFATGARPVVPPIDGLKEYYWTEFLDDTQLPRDQKVLVIGGGLIGLEMSSKLVDGNNQVIIVEMLDEIGRGMEMLEKVQTMKKLEAAGLTVHTGNRVVSVAGNRVVMEDTAKQQSVIEGVDKVIITAGMKSFVPFELKSGIPVHYIGDALKVGKAEQAIAAAHELALTV